MGPIRCAIAALAIAMFVAPAASIKLRIDKEECLSKDLVEGDVVTGSFVTDNKKGGGMFSKANVLSFLVRDPVEGNLYSVEKTDDHRFRAVVTRDGRHHFCLTNSDRQHVREVNLEIHVGHIISHEKALATHMDDIWESVNRLKEALAEVRAEQIYQHHREERHRVTTESTSSRVVVYAALEALAILAVNAMQIYGVRRMFQSKI